MQTQAAPSPTKRLNDAQAPPIIEKSLITSNTISVLEGTSDQSNLDLLRSVAVVLVFVGHTFNFLMVRGMGDLGHFGVLLFFVHTAFVLMFSMERLGLSGSKLFTAFAVRRIFRIYPLSILSVLFVVAVQVPSAPWSNGAGLVIYVWPGWAGFFSNLLLTQNITQSASVMCVLWSLPFEMQMYAFLPFLPPLSFSADYFSHVVGRDCHRGIGIRISEHNGH